MNCLLVGSVGRFVSFKISRPAASFYNGDVTLVDAMGSLTSGAIGMVWLIALSLPV